MKFGVKRSEAPVAVSSGNGSFIKYFGREDKTLRFLQELPEWYEFYDHFNKAHSRSFPCLREDRDLCPGCTSDNPKERSASKRYLVNALDPETGYVDLWKVPASAMPLLDRFSDRDGGTVTARHYTIAQIRTSDDKVSYTVEREEKDNTPISDYRDKMKDFEPALEAAYEELWGDEGLMKNPRRDLGDSKPKKDKKSKKKDKKKNEDEGQYIDDLEKSFAKKAKMGDPPFEPKSEEKTVVYSEDSLADFDKDQLKALFKGAGLPVPRTNDVDRLRSRLLAELGS